MRFPFLAAVQVLAMGAVLPQAAIAQQAKAPAIPKAAASSFATAEVRFGGHYIGGTWVPGTSALEGPSKITITYGQPHMRGRTIVGDLVPFDQVWRLGANLATVLRTDVDMTLGGKFLPQGVYSLYAFPTKNGWQLIINRQIGQWGTEYDASQDVARVPLRSRTLMEPMESLSIYLIPSVDAEGTPATLPHGTLKIVWEKIELTTDWKVGR